jgi:CobQ-like glutamine amidotransferase family enzyme
LNGLPRFHDLLVGFENHSGNTFVGWGNYQKELTKINKMSEVDRAYGVQAPSIIEQDISVLGGVVKGFGNNGIDGHEGAIVENCIGTYLHGPILPKNPQLADWLISVGVSHGKPLPPIDDDLELQTRENVIKSFLRT